MEIQNLPIPRANIDLLDTISHQDNKIVLIAQMTLDSIPFLRFAPSSSYHKQMISDFLSEVGKYMPEYSQRHDLNCSPLPTLHLGKYVLVGMGSGIVVPERKEFIYDTISTDFPLGLNRNHLHELKPFLKGWFIH